MIASCKKTKGFMSCMFESNSDQERFCRGHGMIA